MRISVTEMAGHAGVSRAVIDGRFDASRAADVRAQLENALQPGAARLVIDLATVSFMDSAGLAVLVTALKRARQGGGDVKLVWPAADAARQVLRLTRFDRVFDIADTADEAADRFSQQA